MALKGKGGSLHAETTRRKFLAGATLAPAVLISRGPDAAAATPPFLKEHGFWDYTTPGAGGMEGYQKDDYVRLLDDMSQAGMNSLCIYIKWLTTGYRSRLPFLDQHPKSPVTASGNALLQFAIAEARKRNLKVWLGGAVNYFPTESFQHAQPSTVYDSLGGFDIPIHCGVYGADSPGLAERVVAMYEEWLELFPGVSGLVVELEFAGVETPDRIPRYNQWAKENGRPPFDKLGHPLSPRDFDVEPWRDYTTSTRLAILREVEKSVRNKGFRGDLAMICETGRRRYSVNHDVNLQDYHRQFPTWKAVTYEYGKWELRNAMMDFCITAPKQEGLEVYYLPRGVMTWGGDWPMPVRLEDHWQMDVDDVLQHQPQGLWWFGSGGADEGTHVSISRLRAAGFADGTEARRALLRKVSQLKVDT